MRPTAYVTRKWAGLGLLGLGAEKTKATLCEMLAVQPPAPMLLRGPRARFVGWLFGTQDSKSESPNHR